MKQILMTAAIFSSTISMFLSFGCSKSDRPQTMADAAVDGSSDGATPTPLALRVVNKTEAPIYMVDQSLFVLRLADNSAVAVPGVPACPVNDCGPNYKNVACKPTAAAVVELVANSAREASWGGTVRGTMPVGDSGDTCYTHTAAGPQKIVVGVTYSVGSSNQLPLTKAETVTKEIDFPSKDTVEIEVTESRVCGGKTPGPQDKCQKDEFCLYEVEDACGTADATGICQEKPGACPGVYAPVCGCDNKTHGNACAAYSAGVSIKHNGVCAGPE